MMVIALLASGLGAVSRYGLAGLVQRKAADPRPWGTAAVNLVGALAAGVVVGLAGAGVLGTRTVLIAGSGFLGGFTTFSTWMVESVRLAEDGGVRGLRAAGWNLGGMLVAGVVGVAAGVGLGHAVGAVVS